MDSFFDDVLAALDDGVFVEKPVDVRIFVEGEEYLNQPPLSEMQYAIVEYMSQIYREKECITLYGLDDGINYYKQYTKNELILALGKGSGKDFVSTIAVAYVVYKLLCLNDPARYYGKPSGDAIDIMNVAINAQQARNVFFKGFKSKIEKSPWFQGKFHSKMESIEFDKSITVYSGHSERESHEGLNLFMAILDEISGFAIESTSGHALAKTADAIYRAFRGTVDSRFPDLGKIVLLSFPRFKEDYISQKYNESVADKEVIRREHTFKIDDDLPDGISENEFSISWEEDHIVLYSLPKVFALKRPTWEVNPTRKIDDFRNAFYLDPEDALQRFACLEENELISTQRGIIKIIDAVPGDIVQSQFGPANITHVWSQQKECIRITLKNGQSITCTNDHGLLKVSRVRCGKGLADRLGKYKQEWVEANNLYVGDKLRTSYPNAIMESYSIGVTQSYLLGLILTDGWIRDNERKYIGIACGTSFEYAKSVQNKFNTIKPGCAFISQRQPNPELSNKTQYNVGVTQYDVINKFTNLGLIQSRAQDKVLPDVIYSMNKEEFYAFMSGFIDGDGSFGRAGTITIVSTSKKMLQELQVVMAFHGIKTNLWISKRASLTGKIKSKHDLWGLRLNLYASQQLGPKLSLLSDKKYSNRQNNFLQEGKGIREKEYSEIVSIENVGMKTVVDITTSHHEFIANGVVTHNCMPPDAVGGYFKDHAKIDSTFNQPPAIEEGMAFEQWFVPKEDVRYFMHVDLAQKNDRCAIAMAHVDAWQYKDFGANSYYDPVVTVDFVYWWTPTKEQSVNFDDVRDFIVNVKRMGFDVRAVSFDRWNSHTMMMELNALGIHAENLSVAKKHYDDFKMALMQDNVTGPNIPLLIKELKELRIIKDKVDHPRTGGKDLSDATCGAIFNAISKTPRTNLSTVTVFTLADKMKTDQQEEKSNGIIRPPSKEMPKELHNYLKGLKVI